MLRYQVAVYRYVLRAVRDPHVADDLYQEFALRFVRGDFKRADPQQGRFRDFLKAALNHLIVDHLRKQRRSVPITAQTADPASELSPVPNSDREFLSIWLAEMMARAWAALADYERRTGQYLYTVLRFRTDHLGVKAPQMAEQLATKVGKPLTPGWIRKRLFLAREKFTDLLLDEVAQSLKNPTCEQLEQELLDLGLLEYCRSALQRRARSS
jgi:RNA polymerase sigma-70 factor (ECF subfamily)